MIPNSDKEDSAVITNDDGIRNDGKISGNDFVPDKKMDAEDILQINQVKYPKNVSYILDYNFAGNLY